jgi:hypothetical protein
MFAEYPGKITVDRGALNQLDAAKLTEPQRQFFPMRVSVQP